MNGNMIGNYNEQDRGNPQGQQPMGLQGLVSMPNSAAPGPNGISIPIRIDDGQRNCVVYLNFPPMNIMDIQQLIGQLKTIGIQVADRKNFDDNNNQNYNRNNYNNNYNRSGYNQNYNNSGYNNNNNNNGGGYNNYNRGGGYNK